MKQATKLVITGAPALRYKTVVLSFWSNRSTESVKLHNLWSFANNLLLRDSPWLPMILNVVKDFESHHFPPLKKDWTSNICSIIMERLGNLLFSFPLERNKTGTISNPLNSFLWTPISTTLPAFSLNLQLIFMGFFKWF